MQFNCAQLERPGVGVHLSYKNFREDTLKKALMQVLDPNMALDNVWRLEALRAG